jgi:hypothetical protein
MPDKWPLANGNWSNAANWNGGTKPVAGDDVYADGRTLNVDESFNVATIRNTQRSGGTLGGTFNFNTAGVTGTLTSPTQAIFHGAVNMFTITATSGIVTVSSTVDLTSVGSLGAMFSYTGNCNFTLSANNMFTGNVSNQIVAKSSIGILTVNCGYMQSSGNTSANIINSSAGAVVVNGNVIGGVLTAASAQTIVITGGSSTLIVNGNVTGGVGNNAILTSGTSATITGNVTAGTGAAITSATANIINVTGTVTASATANAISSTNANGQVYLNGNMVNNNGKMAIFAPIVWLDKNNTTSAAFFTSGGVARTLYSADTVPNTPAANNVRSGTIYGAGNSLTGTLVMPVAANVRNGVVYDNGTVGTALFTTSQFITELSSSTTPVAVRMQNLCTPMILGELMEAFKK